MSRTRLPSLLIVMTLACAWPAAAQVSPEEHAKHHPQQPGQPASPPGAAGPPEGTPGAGMMEGMGDMMRNMGVPAPKALYPSLMDLPDLPPDRRDEVQRAAHERMQSGMALMAEALDTLLRAAPANDYAAMQDANAKIREGLARFESGVSAHRALTEGREPRQIALSWFKREMGIAAPGTSHGARSGLGLSPLHLFTMALLIGFAVVMLGLYFFKMRRAAALFKRIDPDDRSPPPGSSPPLRGGPGPPPSSPGSPTPRADASAPPGPQPEKPTARSSASEPSPASAANRSLAAPLTAKWLGRLRVQSVVQETPSVRTYRLRSLDGGPLPFTFVPGQFLNVAFAIGGARMNRSYSISSSPHEREFVELTIKREGRGAVSRHIHDLVTAGDEIQAGGPVGTFTFTGDEADSVVLVSGGVGITPMMSIARHLTARSWPGDIYFIYACRTEADLIFAEPLASLERRNPKFHLVVTMSRPGPGWKGPRGRLTKELLSGAVPNLASKRVHVCGPVPMMDAAKSMLAELGVPPENVKSEQFGAVKPVPAAPGTTAALRPAATGPMVTFATSGKAAKSRPGQTILELSEALGIGIDNSCRIGTCGVCKIRMTSGEVDQEVQDALDEDDKSRGIILACQAKPTTEVTVEA